jgi:hypothetical protein
MTDRADLWVGERDTTSAWIYDPRIRHRRPDTVYLYHVQKSEMREMPTDVREVLTTVRGSARELHIDRYLDWFARHGEEFIANLPPLPADHEKRTKQYQRKRQEERRRRAIERHKQYLQKHRKQYMGVSEMRLTKRRVTHCYSCKEDLDSNLHVQCNSCRWMICYCGACGCGYELAQT